MDSDDLKELVDSWHKAASQLDGYNDTQPDGDGVQLMLRIQRTKEGGLRLQAMAEKDWLATHLIYTPGVLRKFMEDYETGSLDKPSIPFASLEFSKKDV